MDIATMKYEAAERAMNRLGVLDLSPIIRKVTEEIYTTLARDFESYLMSDAELNVAGEIRSIVDATVKALLSGDTNALERYPLGRLYDAPAIREAIASHCGDEVLKMRVADLEEELKRAKECIESMRRTY